MAQPDITDAERQAVAAVLRGTTLSIGEKVEEFERAIAGYAGARHAVAVSSGTAGLHCAVLAAGLTDGDLAITTPFSFVSSANVILYERALPVFVDVEEQTGNMDPHALEMALRSIAVGDGSVLPRRTDVPRNDVRLVLPVHAFGRLAAIEEIGRIAAEHGALVIEDACEALGASRAGRNAGTFGASGVFAFYPNKQITTGEGGMIVTDDERVADICRSLRNQGRDVFDAWLTHSRLGFNYRLDELSAALGCAQMMRIPELLDNRARVAGIYLERLKAIPGVIPPSPAPEGESVSWFVFVVRFEDGLDRNRVMDHLAAQGIPSRPYFSPIHLQPFYRDRFGYREGDFPIAEKLGRSSLALPFFGAMTEGQIDEVCTRLQEAAERA